MSRIAYVSSLDVLNRAIQTYGTETQCVVLFEEMSELQKEVCKHWRGSDNIGAITEELADVHIMLEQLRMMLNISVEDVCAAVKSKVERLNSRLNDEIDKRSNESSIDETDCLIVDNFSECTLTAIEKDGKFHVVHMGDGKGDIRN